MARKTMIPNSRASLLFNEGPPTMPPDAVTRNASQDTTSDGHTSEA